MTPHPTPWDFASTGWFALLGFLVTTLGTILGVIAWRQSKSSSRINDFLFRQAERNIDRHLTDEEIRNKKTEAARISDEITALRNRLEVEIPIEAKRTVLRDRLDGNIKTLHQTLNATMDLKRELASLGTTADLPPDLLSAVKAEILRSTSRMRITSS